MLQLNNRTPFEASISVFPNKDGIDTLYVNVKATFRIGRKWQLSEHQPPPTEVDDYYDDPYSSSLKLASDIHVGKSCTDIIMQGSACTPEGKIARAIDVNLSVGKVIKTVRVFGDRFWENNSITNPQPFEKMPLVYERAYGGSVDDSDEEAEAFDKNPVGVGYAVSRGVVAANGSPLPNLEDPHSLISSPSDMPEPACFSYIAPFWSPRAQYAGTYDGEWESERAPYLPIDFDQRFLQSAPTGLIYPGVITGGEPVEIDGMHPKGKIQFEVPSVNMTCHITLKGRDMKLPFKVESLILHPNDLKVALVWKASFVGDKDVINVRDIYVTLKR